MFFLLLLLRSSSSSFSSVDYVDACLFPPSIGLAARLEIAIYTCTHCALLPPRLTAHARAHATYMGVAVCEGGKIFLEGGRGKKENSVVIREGSEF